MEKHPPRYCTCGQVIPRTDMVHCSSKCYHDSRRGQPCEARRRRGTRTCPQCQTKFEVGGRSGQKWSQIYCSTRCASKAHWAPIDEAFNLGSSGYWRELRAKIVDRDKVCVFCGGAKNLQVHHLVPREYDGGHGEDNLAAACRHCHMVVDAMIKIMKTKNPDFDIRAWLASFMEGH
jgi:5-methylcytosine-specific restriction endonuclease McrA